MLIGDGLARHKTPKAELADAPKVTTGVESKETDTVYVKLPLGLSLDAVAAGLRQYGEVASINLLAGDALSAAVVFYDVRAARRLLSAVGGDAARRAAQTGIRTVRLPGDVHLAPQDVRGVSNIKRDEANGAFTVEFFDARDAERLIRSRVEAAAATPSASSTARVMTSQLKDVPRVGGSNKSKVGRGAAKLASSGQGADEDAVSNARAQAQAAAIAAAAADHRLAMSSGTPLQSTIVAVRGLPNGILSNACFEAVLQQAGLLSSVEEYRMQSGNPCGEAMLRLADPLSAAQCVTHFAGRQWDESGAFVTARLLSSAGRAQPATAACGAANSGKVGGAWRQSAFGRYNSGATEASTDAGASEADEEQEGSGGVWSRRPSDEV